MSRSQNSGNFQNASFLSNCIVVGKILLPFQSYCTENVVDHQKASLLMWVLSPACMKLRPPLSFKT